jgi:hypothetical protein
MMSSDIPIDAASAAVESAWWRPIETAPKDGSVFIGWVSAERWSAVDGGGSGRAHDVSQADFCWWRKDADAPNGGYFDSGAGQIGDAQEVTRWMPMPVAPNVSKYAPKTNTSEGHVHVANMTKTARNGFIFAAKGAGLALPEGKYKLYIVKEGQ